ncbi:MAG TPA: FG-GAP-like repeat-containing protein [Planctomycetota bacterium]|nr:FG-GAP-like repeat-containing protein [Planctomycetota bacterium]
MLGDLDGDGTRDFAVGAWRYEEYVGYVTVYSGRTGSPIATIYGGGKVELGAGPVPPESCGFFKGEAFGKTIVPLEDLDEDGIDDLAIGGDFIDEHGLFSGKSFERLSSLPGRALGMTGDIDGDGRRDIACMASSPHRLWVVSARTRLPLVEGAILDGNWSAASAGDADGDGFLDLIVARGAPTTRPDGPEPKEPIWVRWLSGKTGEVLREMRLEPGGYAREIHCSSMGDLDGDGRSDVLVQTFMTGVGGRRWILSGGSGAILAEDLRPSWTDGQRAVRVGDLDGNGRVEFLVADYESAEGARCGGAVRLGRLRAFVK